MRFFGPPLDRVALDLRITFFFQQEMSFDSSKTTQYILNQFEHIFLSSGNLYVWLCVCVCVCVCACVCVCVCVCTHVSVHCVCVCVCNWSSTYEPVPKVCHKSGTVQAEKKNMRDQSNC